MLDLRFALALIGEHRPTSCAASPGSLDRGTEVWLPTALRNVRDHLMGDVDPE